LVWRIFLGFNACSHLYSDAEEFRKSLLFIQRLHDDMLALHLIFGPLLALRCHYMLFSFSSSGLLLLAMDSVVQVQIMYSRQPGMFRPTHHSPISGPSKMLLLMDGVEAFERMDCTNYVLVQRRKPGAVVCNSNRPEVWQMYGSTLHPSADVARVPRRSVMQLIHCRLASKLVPYFHWPRK
jgi:hypothetical protein